MPLQIPVLSSDPEIFRNVRLALEALHLNAKKLIAVDTLIEATDEPQVVIIHLGSQSAFTNEHVQRLLARWTNTQIIIVSKLNFDQSVISNLRVYHISHSKLDTALASKLRELHIIT